jgi:hypothetical protein
MSFESVEGWCGANVCASVTALAGVGLLFGMALSPGRSDPAWPSPRIVGLALQTLGWGALAAIVTLKVIEDGHWGDLVALVPPVLVVRHAVYLRLVRRRGMAAGGNEYLDARNFDKKVFVDIFANARSAQDREFSIDVLAVRYGVPAAFLGMVSVAYFELLVRGNVLNLLPPMLAGARLGFAGAYVYVLMYLGQRSVRRDLTSGAAVWSVATVTLGPILGAVFALMWHKETNDSEWSTYALYFVVGMSPKYAIAAVEEAVRRLWLTRAGATTVTPNTIGLTQIRGITPEIEDRLAEEGITDATTLAMAAPMKLYRNTAFDQRQILSWMDEAMLTVFFPDDWQDIRRADVSGAIDLAARYGRVKRRAPVEGDAFDILAKRIGKADPLPSSFLREIASMIYEDAQVELIWTLYQANSDGGDDGAAVGPSTPERLQPPRRSARAVNGPAATALTSLAIAAGFALAAMLWSSPWPFSPGQEVLTLLSGATGFGAFAGAWAFRATAPRRPFAGGMAAAVFLGGAVLATGLRPTLETAWTAGATGAMFLIVSSAGLGWTIAAFSASAWIKGRVQIVVSPDDATNADVVLVDGVALDAGKRTAQIGGGAHEIRVTRRGFQDGVRWLGDGPPRDESIAFRLEPLPPARVFVAIKPKSAPDLKVTCAPAAGTKDQPTVDLDAAGTFRLGEGAWTITGSAEGFETKSLAVSVRAGESQDLRLKLRRRRVRIDIEVPSGGEVTQVVVDGEAQPFQRSPQKATCLLRTGAREIRAHWRGTRADGAAQEFAQTQLVVIADGGSTVSFAN